MKRSQLVPRGPIHLHVIAIDWHPGAGAARRLRSRADARLTGTRHTWDTFRRQLGELVVRYPELSVDALVEDGARTRWLFRARAGRVDELWVVERLADAPATPVDLPYDDVVTVTLARRLGGDPAGAALELPLYYADEPALREAIDQIAGAIREGVGAFVADAGPERFLVALAPGASTVRRLVAATEPELVARLLRRAYAAGPPAREVTSRAGRSSARVAATAAP